MQDLSHHILDVAENSVRAGAALVEIRLVEDQTADRLRLEIADNGAGMDEEMRQSVMSPFTTSRTERSVGLGLALLAQAARETGGECHVESAPGEGTRVNATFALDHIDRKPVGDLGETMMTLIVGNPDVDFLLERTNGGTPGRLDTREIRQSLGGGALCTAAGLRALRSLLGQALQTRADEHTQLKGDPRCLSKQ